jgi:hypothetical protein
VNEAGNAEICKEIFVRSRLSDGKSGKEFIYCIRGGQLRRGRPPRRMRRIQTRSARETDITDPSARDKITVLIPFIGYFKVTSTHIQLRIGYTRELFVSSSQFSYSLLRAYTIR